MNARYSLPAMLFVIAATIPLCADEREDKLFEALTSRVWTRGAPGAFGYRETLALRRDGTYHWERTSDYTERDDKGAWSFVATGDSAGVLRLAATGDVPFTLKDGKLTMFGGGGFTAGERIAYTAAQTRLGAADLKPVEPHETTRRLTKTAWIKTNPFDVYRLPDRIEFALDGRFTAVYRDGACRHGGVWGVMNEAGRVKLVARSDENECDLRGGSAGLSQDYITFLGDLLLLGDSYAPVDKKLDTKLPAANVFVFDRYGSTVRTRGEFRGPLAKGKPVRLELLHESAGIGEYELKSLEIGFQTYKLFPKGFTAEGEVAWVASKDLSGQRVTAAAPVKQVIEFTPPISGDYIAFSVRLNYENVSQPFDGHATYITRIAEE